MQDDAITGVKKNKRGCAALWLGWLLPRSCRAECEMARRETRYFWPMASPTPSALPETRCRNFGQWRIIFLPARKRYTVFFAPLDGIGQIRHRKTIISAALTGPRHHSTMTWVTKPTVHGCKLLRLVFTVYGPVLTVL